MKISTKGRYALRLMLDLAVHNGSGHTPLKEVARRQDISEKYLEQIVMQLGRAGLVKSIRGAHGGYKIQQQLSNITIGDILRAVEGSLAPVECLEKDNSNVCKHYDICVAVDVWRKLHEAVNNVVDGITLEDLVEEYNKKNSRQV